VKNSYKMHENEYKFGRCVEKGNEDCGEDEHEL
jgi:hypothetical protein